MRKLLGITYEHPFIIFDDEKIYLFFDISHLLKSVRNYFKKYNFSGGDNISPLTTTSITWLIFITGTKKNNLEMSQSRRK